jgi:hypothetical protein
MLHVDNQKNALPNLGTVGLSRTAPPVRLPRNAGQMVALQEPTDALSFRAAQRAGCSGTDRLPFAGTVDCIPRRSELDRGRVSSACADSSSIPDSPNRGRRRRQSVDNKDLSTISSALAGRRRRRRSLISMAGAYSRSRAWNFRSPRTALFTICVNMTCSLESTRCWPFSVKETSSSSSCMVSTLKLLEAVGRPAGFPECPF